MRYVTNEQRRRWILFKPARALIASNSTCQAPGLFAASSLAAQNFLICCHLSSSPRNLADE